MVMKDIPDQGGIPGAYVSAYNRMMRQYEEDDMREEAVEDWLDSDEGKEGAAERTIDDGFVSQAFRAMLEDLRLTAEEAAPLEEKLEQLIMHFARGGK